MKKFINISNHPSSKWPTEQMNAAKELAAGGDVIDIAFPNVPPMATTVEVEVLAEELLAKVLEVEDPIVHLMGESTLLLKLANLLHEAGIPVVCSTTERVSVESIGADGVVTKTLKFKFEQFRSYF